MKCRVYSILLSDCVRILQELFNDRKEEQWRKVVEPGVDDGAVNFEVTERAMGLQKHDEAQIAASERRRSCRRQQRSCRRQQWQSIDTRSKRSEQERGREVRPSAARRFNPGA